MPHVVVDHIIDAPHHQVWAAVTDWSAQSTWVLLTTVVAGPDGGQGVGGELEAFTGFHRFGLGVNDPMLVVEWEPPRRCVVAHRGAVVRGRGVIEVMKLPDDRSRLVWIEDLELPFGRLGHIGWPLARPIATWGIRHSLRRFAALVEGRAEPAS